MSENESRADETEGEEGGEEEGEGEPRKPVIPPPAVLARLIERDGQVWEIGQPWPRPKNQESSKKPNQIDCNIATILYITGEIEQDEDGEETEIDPYYQIVGLPIEGGILASSGFGVTTDIQLEDVRRVEGLQRVEVLQPYLMEMMKDVAGVVTEEVPEGG